MEYTIVEDDVAGKRINLSSPLTNSVIDFINEHNLKSILLNQRLGWKSQELSLLTQIKDLKCLYLMDDEIEDISVIEKLTSLENLLLECSHIKRVGDLSKLIRLNRVSIDWRPCLDSLHQLNSLECIRIDKYKAQDLSKFISLPNLKRLDLVMGTINSLTGIERFTNLEKLMLYRCSKLTDISSVTKNCIKELEIESCKKIANLEVTFEVRTLEKLIIDKCQEIGSITGISNLTKLNKVTIADTIILDGDMKKFGLLHNKGVKVWFTNKKFYSHKLEDFIGKPKW
ncbi:hypothetical protein [uncultured Shewanella sp.]|uniref:hypothetical protein n=1 Tax=uncultured Shewanella sp. TaxID=173975 RepID=UPI0026218D31|nr:hypothetical protein [uncultured Shewanella sp.]